MTQDIDRKGSTSIGSVLNAVCAETDPADILRCSLQEELKRRPENCSEER